MRGRLRRIERMVVDRSNEDRKPHFVVVELAKIILEGYEGIELVESIDTDDETWRRIDRLRREARGEYVPSDPLLKTKSLDEIMSRESLQDSQDRTRRAIESARVRLATARRRVSGE